jgi:hypothetical protein
MPKTRTLFRDCGTILEPVATCLQRQADFLAATAEGKPGESFAHSAVVQAQHRVEQAVKELQQAERSPPEMRCDYIRNALDLLRGLQ